MRNALISWLTEKANKCDDIILLSGDLGYSVIEPFVEKNNNRFINVGVAEQNMTGIAAGLAMEGFRPYNYSIGIFPTWRCAEQIRNDIDYHDLPVVICAIGSGVAYGNLGYSHHAVQDLALMRSLPNMLIGTPCDPNEVREILEYNYKNPSPLYLRLHKAGEKRLNGKYEGIKPGKLRRLYTKDEERSYDGDYKSCVICIGHIAGKVVELCKGYDFEIPIYSVPLWGAPASKSFSEEIIGFDTIITIEDHILEGGFGSYTLEVSAKYKLDKRIIPIAIDQDIMGKVAREETLLQPLVAKLKNCLERINKGLD